MAVGKKIISQWTLLWPVLLIGFSASVCLSQQAPPRTPEKTTPKTITKGNAKPDLRVDNLIQLARSASPEVAVDALLTISTSKLLTDKTRKIELIEEAFRLSSKVREPIKRQSVGLAVDSRAGYKTMAYAMGLDRLSLQTKAVASMIPLDAFRARTMFEEISLPRVPTLSCADSLVYNFDAYYETLLTVADRAFNEEEKKSLAHIQFITARLQESQSVFQLTAVAKLILNAIASSEEAFTFVSIFSKNLDRLSTEPRSFAFLIERDSFLLTVHKLIFKLKERQVAALELTNAVRRFLLKNMSAAACQDVTWIKKGKPVVPPVIERLNVEFATPITADDIKPESFGPKADDVEYWSSKSGIAILRAARDLRFGGTSEQLNLEQRKTEEWSDKLQRYLNLLEAWDAAAEASDEDYFQQKCNAYRVIVDLCPNDQQRQAVLRSYSSYLLEADKRYKGSIEWILPVKEYLRALRFKDDQIRTSSLEPWVAANDTNLRVYGEMTLMLN